MVHKVKYNKKCNTTKTTKIQSRPKHKAKHKEHINMIKERKDMQLKREIPIKCDKFENFLQ